MYIENGEKYFENRLEQLEYQSVLSFIMSFYKNKKDLKVFLNNIQYLRNEKDDKFFKLYKKDIQSILYLYTLENPKYKYLYEDYKVNKKNNIISFVLVDSYHLIIQNCRLCHLIK